MRVRRKLPNKTARRHIPGNLNLVTSQAIDLIVQVGHNASVHRNDMYDFANGRHGCASAAIHVSMLFIDLVQASRRVLHDVTDLPIDGFRLDRLAAAIKDDNGWGRWR